MTDDQDTRTPRTTWIVTPDDAAMRLDAFLRHRMSHLSRRAIADAIENNHFRLNGRRTAKGIKLAAGDVVSFHGPESLLLELPPPANGLLVPIVFEDDSLLIIDKPAGMATHGFSGADTGTVANFIAAIRPEILNIGKNRWEPGLVHRLDRNTSGLLVIAKTQFAFDGLRAQFSARRISKKYQALVWGILPEEGTVRYPLAHDPDDKARMIAVVSGSEVKAGQRIWDALTRFRILSASPNMSLAEISMETGVMHQIRVHLAAIDHPIVGDRLYGRRYGENFGFERHFLHASSLEFRHPALSARVKIESPLPAEFQVVFAAGSAVAESGTT